MHAKFFVLQNLPNKNNPMNKNPAQITCQKLEINKVYCRILIGVNIKIYK